MKFRTLLPTLVIAACSSLLVAEPPLPADGIVRYSQFGAKGDGKTDDIDAIASAHAFANKHNLPVRADDDATYYISGKNQTAIIQTDTDFGTAKFIIDDTDVERHAANVFLVTSKLKPIKPKGITSLRKNQEKIDITLPEPSLILVTDANVKRHIRYGNNRNNGASQTDIFIVDKEGNINADTPIIWDFDQITSISALPIDPEPLTIRGGHFTTIANRVETKPKYFARAIGVRRSNVVIDGVEHHVTGEGELGSPYAGFINISNCAYVEVKNCILSGRKTAWGFNDAGKKVSTGTYDILLVRASNVSFTNCSQTNDINDPVYWGIMGSNYCKNIVLDNCSFSRFDAHAGVTNATIRNSTLGYQGINAIGGGTLTVENTTVYGRSFINLRQDYGSTWQGQVFIKDCVFIPFAGKPASASLIGGANAGQHNFGYTCYMPEKITIEGLRIDDSNHPKDYQGPAIFANFNRRYTDASYKEQYPCIKTKEVILKDVSTASGKPLRLSDNPFMFKSVTLRR